MVGIICDDLGCMRQFPHDIGTELGVEQLRFHKHFSPQAET